MKKTFLMLGLLFGSTAIYAQNLLDMSSWTIGTGSTGAFNKNGQTSENSRVWGTGPNGNRVILWKAIPEGYAIDDGGWDHNFVGIEHTSAYRLSVWIKKTGSNGGFTYFGTNNVSSLDNTPLSNPYFWEGDLPQLNRWYLLIGHIHGSGDNSMVNLGGIYDGVTGEKITSITDFKFAVGTTGSNHRAYLFYDPNTSDEQYFYAPRMERIDGHEPSINTLLGFQNVPIQASLPINDNRTVTTTPDSYSQSFRLNFKEGVTIGLPNAYYTTMGLRGWSENSGGKAHEFAFSNDSKSSIFFRSGLSPSWEGWRSLMISSESGDYGIATSNPRAALDVAKYLSNAYSTVLGRQTEGDAVGNGTFLGLKNYDTSVIDGKSFALVHNFYGEENSSINFLRGNTITGGSLSFSTGTNTEKLRITANGNVGIGTITPHEKLSVNGKIRAHEIKVETTNWPDYVFEEGYEKISLAALEEYIKLNRHLPNMPTAKETQVKGIELGELGKQLLKNQEELTLHLIEQDKKINELLKVIARQQAQIEGLEKNK